MSVSRYPTRRDTTPSVGLSGVSLDAPDTGYRWRTRSGRSTRRSRGWSPSAARDTRGVSMVARVYQSVQTRVFMDTVFGQTRVNVKWVLVEKTVQNVRNHYNILNSKPLHLLCSSLWTWLVGTRLQPHVSLQEWSHVWSSVWWLHVYSWIPRGTLWHQVQSRKLWLQLCWEMSMQKR